MLADMDVALVAVKVGAVFELVEAVVIPFIAVLVNAVVTPVRIKRSEEVDMEGVIPLSSVEVPTLVNVTPAPNAVVKVAGISELDVRISTLSFVFVLVDDVATAVLAGPLVDTDPVLTP